MRTQSRGLDLFGTKGRFRRGFKISGLAALQLVVLPVFAAGVRDSQVSLDIASQPVSGALTDFARQTGLQVLYPDGPAVLNARSPAIYGKYTVEAALGEMLGQSDLRYEFVTARAISISVKQQKESKLPVPLLLAQSSSAAARANSVVPVADRAQSRPGLPQSEASPRSGEDRAPLAEVVVTGTHIRGSDAPVGSSLLKISKEDIDASGFVRIEDVIRSMPQTFGGGVSQDGIGFGGSTQATNLGNGTAINLRGLGASATLTLLNGRRLAPSGTTGEFTDISNIPSAAIERVEILPDGASAAYGSDAIGGVVNLILRTDYEGAETSAHFGQALGGIGPEYDVAQVFGGHWASGHALVSLDYYRRAAVPASAFSLTSDSDFTASGGSNFDSRFDNPGTIQLGSRTFAIPQGQDGTHLTSAAFTPGTVNLRNTFEFSTLVPHQERESVFAHLSQSINNDITAFAEIFASHRQSSTFSGAPDATLSVPSSNPFYVNPLGGTGPVTVLYNLTADLGAIPTTAVTRATTGTLGIRKLTERRWELGATVSAAREHTESQTQLVDFAALNRAVVDSNPTTAFNAFGDGSHTNPATLAGLLLASATSANSVYRTVAADAEGPISVGTWTELRVAVGAAYSTDDLSTAGNLVTRFSGSRHTRSAYAELLVPLLGMDENVMRQKLTLSLAGRHEHYTDFGTSNVPRVGLSWSPNSTISLRGSWGKSFRAPPLPSLDESANISTILPPQTDPLSSTGRSSVLYWKGNNANLGPESARTWSAGLDLTPEKLSRLAINVTYFDSKYEGKIGNPSSGISPLLLLTNPQLQDLVIRNPTSAEFARVCQSSRFIGSISACLNGTANVIFDGRLVNSAITETNGIDLLGTYSQPSRIGVWGFGLNATYTFRFATALTSQSPLLNLVDTVGRPLRFRTRGSLSWRESGFGVVAFVNYNGSYEDTIDTPVRAIPSWTTFDATLSYQGLGAGKKQSEGLSVSLNIRNAFDRVPPFVNNGFGYDRDNADYLGRVFSLNIKKAW